jgi:hypothetical protein
MLNALDGPCSVKQGYSGRHAAMIITEDVEMYDDLCCNMGISLHSPEVFPVIITRKHYIGFLLCVCTSYFLPLGQ